DPLAGRHAVRRQCQPQHVSDQRPPICGDLRRGSEIRSSCRRQHRRVRASGTPGKLVWCLRDNYTFAAMDFGRRLGASDEHIPKWICKERATTPPHKRHAALRVALKLAWGFVAQSVEYRWGYTPSLAPRPRPISAQRMYSYFGDTTLAAV